jgi:hypothetical protein
MPCVMRMDGFVFYMYFRDHGVPHVHAGRAGVWCVIGLGTPDKPPYILEEGDMKPIDARRAVWIVNSSQELLLANWRKHSGKSDA